MARLRSVAPPQPLAVSTQKRRVLREKTNTTPRVASSNDADSDSRKVKKSKQADVSSRTSQRDVLESRTKAVKSTRRQQAPRRDDPSSDLENLALQDDTGSDRSKQGSSETAQPSRRPTRGAVHSKTGGHSLNDARKEGETTAQRHRAHDVLEHHVATDDDDASEIVVRAPSEAVARGADVPTPNKAVRRSSIVQPPGSVLRLQNTPALENSILALRNFKRRPRQPSMLQMVQQRTASARPSVAHETDLDDSALSGLNLDLDSDGEDLDDFAPDAEGTPLHERRSDRGSSGVTARLGAAGGKMPRPDAVPTSSKRGLSNLDDSVGSMEAIRAKRQRVTNRGARGVVNPSTAASALHQPEAHGETSEILVIHSDASTLASSPVGTPAMTRYELERNHNEVMVPSTEPELNHGQQADTDREDDAISSTMADPLSSSPASVAPPNRANDPDLADPLSQLSPSPPASPTMQRRRPRGEKSRPVMTATLQSLLPKRRRNLEPRTRKTAYDFGEVSEDERLSEITYDASHLEDDVDELHARPRRAAPTSSVKESRQQSAVRQKRAASTRKTASSTLRPVAAQKPQSKRPGRTYGRATQSDKDNDEFHEPEDEEAEESTLPDISITMHEAAQGKELENARRKFAEVDEWDMEFETMSAEDHRSSSQNWR